VEMRVLVLGGSHRRWVEGEIRIKREEKKKFEKG